MNTKAPATTRGLPPLRDAVKKEALRKAAIGCREVVAGHATLAELKQLVEKLVSGVDDR